MSTALVLMNRLRAKAREEQVTAFAAGDDLHVALLSELNQAARIVLEERTWNFQHRSDGTLTLRLSNNEITGSAVSTVSALALTALDTVPETVDLNGQFTTSFVFNANPTYGNTAFDLTGCRLGGAGVTATLPAMPYSTLTSVGWLLFVYQYALPTTVRAVTEIWHQEQDLEIFQEAEHDFRQLVPRPHEDHGSMPQVAFLGGTLTTTVSNASTSTGSELDAIRIWPVPGTRELLHYRYIKRFGDLAVATDAFNGMPLFAEDLIVQLAYARQLQSIQADLTRGMQMEAHVMAEMDQKHRNNRFDPRRSRQLRSLDDIGRTRSQLNRTHDTVPGFP